jgi:hypothetical protein
MVNFKKEKFISFSFLSLTSLNRCNFVILRFFHAGRTSSCLTNAAFQNVEETTALRKNVVMTKSAFFDSQMTLTSGQNGFV